LNDSSPKNKHWAVYAQLFDTAELNLMEKQLLCLLEYDLRFDESVALAHWEPFLEQASAAAAQRRAARERSSQEARAAALDRVSRAGRSRLAVSVPPKGLQLPSPLPSPADSIASTRSVSSASNEISSTSCVDEPAAARAPGPFLAVPGAHARASSVPAPTNVSSASLVSSSGDSEMSSLTDDAGSSSSSEDEVASPDKAGSGAFRRFILRPRARHASASTITPASLAVSTSAESVVSRIPRAVDGKRYSAAHARRESGAPLATSASAASFLSRMWGAARGTPPAVADKGAVPGAMAVGVDVDVHVVDGSEAESDAPRAHPLGPRFVGGPPGSGSFRRLVYARSFRATAPEA
jgi:G1/S-specific cyclin PLC1